jgi:hypothetical protein
MLTNFTGTTQPNFLMTNYHSYQDLAIFQCAMVLGSYKYTKVQSWDLSMNGFAK